MSVNAVNARAAAPYPGRRLLGYPTGSWLIIGVEGCERFSFYGMLAILALFLTSDSVRGGFGWTDARALGFVGIYSGFMYALPAFGGYLADHVLGQRRAVAIGATLMLVGQILMISPFFIPVLLSDLHSAPLFAALRSLDAPLGYLIRPASVSEAIAARGPALSSEHGVKWLTQAYAAVAFGFYTAITCLCIGNALMKSSLVMLCGQTFADGDPAREGAYSYYYLSISVGALLSGVIVGFVADSFGWHYGFGANALSMAVALAAYLTLNKRLLGSIGLAAAQPEARAHAEDGNGGASTSRQNRSRLMLILYLAILLCVFSAGAFQLFGSWSLFIEESVDRSIRGFVIPVPWFSAADPAVVIACAPIVAALWVRFARHRPAVDIVYKYAFSLFAAAAAHFLMWWSATIAAGGARAPGWISLSSVALIAIGELVAWTSTYGIVYRAAPAGYGSATMGAWYLMTLGLGGYLSGLVGQWVEVVGYRTTFISIALVMTAAAFVPVLLRGPLRRLAKRAGVSL